MSGLSHGALTTIERQAQKLLIRWIPKWYEVFYDPVQGNFHERLTRGFKPVPDQPRRLLTQCRQLAMYSSALMTGETLGFNPDLRHHFEQLCRQYYVPETGGWRFSIDDQGRPKDPSYDLYSLSFVIFALTHYYRATQDEEAHTIARDTLRFIDRKFRAPDVIGFAEALGQDLKPLPRIRRQNPHMHLFEACLFAADIWDDNIFKACASELAGLFFTYFYDGKQNQLCEWFNDDLTPHEEKGHIVEPGHYYEWVWLLNKFDAKRYRLTCEHLLEWANTYGWDAEYGGIYDELTPEGDIISDTKRIWPFTEAIKANALMLPKFQPLVKQERKNRIAEMVAIFKDKYIEDRGFWTERLNRDLSPLTDYMPGTTPYHVYFGIMETRSILRARGSSKSVMLNVYAAIYRARRKVSARLRAFKRSRKLTTG